MDRSPARKTNADAEPLAARLFRASAFACAGAFAGDTLLTWFLAISSWLRTGEGVALETLGRVFLLAAGLWTVVIPFVFVALVLVWSAGRCLRWLTGMPTDPPVDWAPWLWAGAIGSAVYVLAVAETAVRIGARFNAAALEALLTAVLSLGIGAMVVVAVIRLRQCLVGLAPRLSKLGRYNPLAQLDVAIVAFGLLFTSASFAVSAVRSDLAPLVPRRHVLALLLAVLGVYGARRWSRRLSVPVLSALPTVARVTAWTIAGAIVALALLWGGSGVHAKYTAQAHSPPLASLMSLVRTLNDIDGDGYGSLLGENDCAPFDASIHPAARDVPNNGIDENCNGGDFVPAAVDAPRSESPPVPAEFQRPWRFLLLTIDTVRYDHTSFGGYLAKSGRDTTPNLARLVQRSISFEFAHAPSAGTMASIPAILTSKFFHSGIALGPERKGMPPILKEQNLLLPELLRPLGYRTGAILSHYYFDDWGMEQGFDHYDNEIGKDKDPYKVSSAALTDKALAWISRNYDKKWFLWVHYLDPHGRYVAHPDQPSYGATEKDLYDGELRHTDAEVGRLLSELAKMPGRESTIVIVTSDHGDGFNEHGFINHGMALYRELLHVPLIIYVPGANPRQVAGAVTPLDIVPTIAQLAGADTARYQFEGESLVPQLFYGTTDRDRVVYAETNWPQPLRAAVTESYKLIYNLKSNVYELYDLKKDPWEKKNVWGRRRKAGDTMKAALDSWLERVFYARDFESNQVTSGALAGVLLEAKPRPAHAISATLDSGAIRVLGFDGPLELAPGKTHTFKVYFQAHETPSASFPLLLELASADRPIRSRPIIPGKGLFPTSRWRSNDYVAVAMTIRVPATAPPGPRQLTVTLQGVEAAPAPLAEVHIGGAAVPPKPGP